MDMTDISKEAVEREVCHPIIAYVHDGRQLSEKRLAGIIDIARAQAARIAELEAQAAKSITMDLHHQIVAQARDTALQEAQHFLRTHEVGVSPKNGFVVSPVWDHLGGIHSGMAYADAIEALRHQPDANKGDG